MSTDNVTDIKTNDKEAEMRKKFLSGLDEILTNSVLPFTLRGYSNSLMSGGYDNADRLHQIFHDFGYPENLQWTNFWNMYRRFGIATAVCEKPIEFCWLDNPEIKGGDKFENEFEKLAKKTRLWKRMRGLDVRQRVGRYAGLFIRAKDNRKPEEPLQSLNGIDSIETLTPVYEGQLVVSKTEQDQSSPRYGMPVLYEYRAQSEGQRNKDAQTSFHIHYTRVIIASEGADDGSIYGKSALENVFNDLLDLRKICGSGGEGFYQNTRNAPVINVKDEFEKPEGKKLEKLNDEVDEYLNKWRKRFIAEGLEFDYPNIQLSDPEPFYANSINNVAAGSKIPVNVLLGTQTGRLAGDKDNEHFLKSMNSRRVNVINEYIEDFIEWCVEYNVLPEPTDLEIEWEDLLSQTDDEKFDIATKMAKINETQFRSGGGPVYSEEEIREATDFEPEELPEPNETLEDDDDQDDIDDASGNE